jgi:hypothetical protein
MCHRLNLNSIHPQVFLPQRVELAGATFNEYDLENPGHQSGW